MSKQSLMTATFVVAFAAAGVAFAQMPVSQKDKMFHPDDLTAKVGDVVHIANDDDVAHNALVVGPSGKLVNSGLQKPGGAADITLDEAGTFTVRCGIHPKMKLIIHAQ